MSNCIQAIKAMLIELNKAGVNTDEITLVLPRAEFEKLAFTCAREVGAVIKEGLHKLEIRPLEILPGDEWTLLHTPKQNLIKPN